MLRHLSIKNLAIVDEVHIDLEPGMSVITGETGVGKSLMVDGLALIMGQRAESNLIGAGANNAEVSAVFDLSAAPAAQQWLDDKLIALSEGQGVVRRALSKTGPSRAFINGTAVTLAELKDFGALLIDIHAQHEHQVLLKKDGQRLLFDEFAGAQINAQTVASLYENWTAQKDALVALSATQQERLDRQRLLEYQLDELLKLDLKADEAETLDQELVLLANAEEDIALGSAAVSLVDDGNAEGGLERLKVAALNLSKMKDPRVEAPLKDLSRSIVQIEETHRDLTRILESSAIDPTRLRWVESRLGKSTTYAASTDVPRSRYPTYRARCQPNSSHCSLQNLQPPPLKRTSQNHLQLGKSRRNSVKETRKSKANTRARRQRPTPPNGYERCTVMYRPDSSN